MQSDPHMFNIPMGEGLASPREASFERGGRVPIFSDLESKYDLFGMKIKSYHYVPSD